MRWIRPPMRSPTSSASGRITTSSLRSLPLSCSSLLFDCAGSVRSITASRVNTAVDNRNGTSTTIRFMNAVTSSAATSLRRRLTRMAVSLSLRYRNGSARRRRRFGLDALHQIQEADLGGLQAVDDLGSARLQEGVDQQERNRHHQR